LLSLNVAGFRLQGITFEKRSDFSRKIAPKKTIVAGFRLQGITLTKGRTSPWKVHVNKKQLSGKYFSNEGCPMKPAT